MKNRDLIEIRLACLEMAGGNILQAQAIFMWATGGELQAAAITSPDGRKWSWDGDQAAWECLSERTVH